jgi:4-hydroxy-tetrahydrodipicolinate synthase
MPTQIVSAVPVPFTEEGAVDIAEYEATLRSVDEHVHGVLVAGTTGEFPALDDDERVELFRRAADVLGKERVIAHLGHASTRQVLRLADATAATGITRFALLTPYYLPADDDGVRAFFGSLTEAHPEASVYAYVFPERTGMDISVDLLRDVMKLPGMVGVKLSGDAAERLPEYAEALHDGQELYSGDDGSLPFVRDHGGAGIVSGVSSAFPATLAGLARALDEGDADGARAVQENVRRLVGLVGPTIPRLKVALAARTGAEWACRMPLPAVSARLREEIGQAVAEFD